jgi:hypothetical protein
MPGQRHNNFLYRTRTTGPVKTVLAREEIEMEIQDPVANLGDTVMVHNYRCNRKDGSKVFEKGVVKRLAYINSFGDFYWSYDVMLIRRSNKNNAIWLSVGDDGINGG